MIVFLKKSHLGRAQFEQLLLSQILTCKYINTLFKLAKIGVKIFDLTGKQYKTVSKNNLKSRLVGTNAPNWE